MTKVIVTSDGKTKQRLEDLKRRNAEKGRELKRQRELADQQAARQTPVTDDLSYENVLTLMEKAWDENPPKLGDKYNLADLQWRTHTR